MTEHTLPDEYRKKPVVIKARQWFSNGHCPVWAQKDVKEHGTHFQVTTLEGVMIGNPGDWIIQGVKGEIYPCKPDIFEATYEPVRAPIQAAHDFVHEGRGFNCGWCGQRFAETQHGKFCANSDCTKSPSYKPPQAAQSDVRGILASFPKVRDQATVFRNWVNSHRAEIRAALSKDDGLLHALKQAAIGCSYIELVASDITDARDSAKMMKAEIDEAIAAAASKGGA